MDNMIRLEFMSLTQNEAFARSVAAAFIAPLDPTVEELADVRTAVSEAVTNAIIHGYRRRRGMVSMLLTLKGRLFTARIEDKGCGIEDIELAMRPFYTTGNRDERSGMGFAVMAAFMDGLHVESKVGEGTAVTMEKLISRREEECEGGAERESLEPCEGCAECESREPCEGCAEREKSEGLEAGAAFGKIENG